MSQTETISWPPAYIIKKHHRARHVKLRAVKPCQLVITVPYRFNLNEIPSILEEKRNWITKQLLYLQSQQVETLPDKINLAMKNETWSVQYMACQAKLRLIERPLHEIVLVGVIKDQNVCKKVLIAWLKNYAKHHLIAKMKSLSDRLHLDFASLSIKNQKSLWGSCTRDKSINLNYKLIFLPVHLAEHVMIHELCHTKYLNHSPKFWQLVLKHDPACEQHKRELRQAEQYIPAWV